MRALAWILIGLPLAAGCGAAPDLPPQDSMIVDFGNFDSSNALVDTTKRTHWGDAVIRVAILNTWVGLGLAPAAGVFAAAHSQQPKADGDRWIWTYKVKNLAVDATATLSARIDGKASVWEMRVTGRVGSEQLQDFLWYDGRYEVSSGNWQFHNAAGKLVRIDWTVAGPADKELTFTDNSGTANDGNFLSYKRAGDLASVSYDFKQDRKADISWSVSTKAGSITAADFAGHVNQKACWDSKLFDAECT